MKEKPKIEIVYAVMLLFLAFISGIMFHKEIRAAGIQIYNQLKELW